MTNVKIRISSYVLIIVGITIAVSYFASPIINNYFYDKHTTTKISMNESYFAIISIPKIDLKRELYPSSNINNNLNKNLLVLSKSVFPDQENSNIIIAGHSGTGSNAYFQNLYKLNLNDEIIIYYNNNIYTYTIIEIEIAAKTGELYIKNDYAKMITLITCTKNDNKTQTIYYGVLKNTENMTKIN